MQQELNLPRKHKVVFKGALKKFGTFEVAGYTASDCIRGVAIQIPELYTRIMNGYFIVRHKNGKYKETMTLESATQEIFNYNEQQIIEVIPAVVGASGGSDSGNIGMAIAGALLLIAGIVVSVFTAGAASPILAAVGAKGTAIIAGIAGMAVSAGLSMVFSGVAGLLAKQEDEKQEEQAYSFSGATNISKQGVPIPLIYGKVGVGSNLVSSLLGKIYGTPEFPAGKIDSGVSSSLRITELLGEGEIYGLVDGEKSILLDGVPLVREDGTKTYPNTAITFCTGINNPKDPYADGVNTPINSGGQFEDKVWQTFTIADPRTDVVNITLRFPALYYQDKKDGHTDYLTTTFEVQTAGEDLVWQPASFNTAGNEVKQECLETTIYSKISQNKQKDDHGVIRYTITHTWRWIGCDGKEHTESISNASGDRHSLPKVVQTMQTTQTQTSSFSLGSFPVRAETKTNLDLTIQVDVAMYDRSKPRYFRIRQLKAGGSNIYVDDCSLVLYSEQINLKMNYEGRAVVYMALNAEDFHGQLPSRIYEVKGLIIDVPSNYDPETRIYNGIWDGTFKKAWTNNPVWVFFDLLTNGKYGLGRDIGKNNVDKWSLYYAAMYCDELVSDGKGGKEPRFTFNGVINDREDAYTVLSNVAGVFRSMLFAANNQIFLAQDAPQTPKRTFGNINVIGGLFNYEGSAATARHTAVEVTWINPDNTWQTEKEIYEDGELIQRYGYNVKSVTALGCTSKGQAQRIARHTIYSEEYENDTVTFQVGLQDSDIRPGDIIYIQDEMIANEVLMGVIKEISTQTIIIDRTIMMTMGQTYAVILTDELGNTYVKNLVNREMETDTLWIKGDEFFTQEQIKNFKGASFWTLTSDSVRPRKFRVLTVVEEAEDKGTKFTITALLHFDEKYKLIDENIQFDRPPINSQPQGELQAPVSFQARQSLEKVEGIVVINSDCSWGLPSDVRVSAVEVKISYPNSEGYVNFGLINDTKLRIENVGVGEMRAKLRCYSDITQTYSQEIEFITQIDSPYVNPPMPMNLKAEAVAGIATFKWDKPFYDFPLTYEYYFITPNGTDTPIITTNNAASISRVFNQYPATVSFYVRSINEVGMMSDYAKTSVQVTPADVNIGDFLEDIDDSWLTGDSQQMIGSGGLLEQLSTALLRAENYTVYRVDRTDKELAIAVDGLSALTEDHRALASRVTFLGAFVGEQVTSTDPAKFNLKWYDGSDPKYPKTPNPLYDNTKPTTVENYPYLPVYPQSSLGGQLMEVYSGDDFVKGQLTNDLRAEFNGVTSEIKQNMVTVVNNKGEIQSDYTVRVDGTNREGQPVIGGFGLRSDGYNTSFGVNAHTFWIKDPNWTGTPTNIYDGYLFVTDVQHNVTYIGTDNTIFKGKVQSLSYLDNNKEGFSLNPVTNTFELNSQDLRFRIDNTSHNKWYKRKGASFAEIVDIGESESTGYSYSVKVNVTDFDNSAMNLNAKNKPYTDNISKPKYLENTCLAINGGSYGIKDISNDNCYLEIKNQHSLVVHNFTQNHSTLKFPSYELQFDFSTGSLERLDQEVANYNIMLSYFVLKTLNNMVNADPGSVVCLPCPFTRNPDVGEVFDLRPLYHDIWIKTTPGKIISYNQNLSIDVAQPDYLFGSFKYYSNNYDSNEEKLHNLGYGYLYARFDDKVGGRNRFRYYHPSRFAGWERITNSGIYAYNVETRWSGVGKTLDDPSKLPYSLIYQND